MIKQLLILTLLSLSTISFACEYTEVVTKAKASDFSRHFIDEEGIKLEAENKAREKCEKKGAKNCSVDMHCEFIQDYDRRGLRLSGSCRAVARGRKLIKSDFSVFCEE